MELVILREVGYELACQDMRLDQPGGPINSFSVLFLFFSLMMIAESSFRNVVVL
jgi:hypothetical protein